MRAEHGHRAAAGDELLQGFGVGRSDAHRVEAAGLEERLEALGGVDILVANAGLQQDAASHEMTLDQWRKVIDVNLTGQFLCCRAAIRAFLAQGMLPEISRAAGKIVCMSSVHEVIMWAGHVNYAASKGGVKLSLGGGAWFSQYSRIRCENPSRLVSPSRNGGKTRALQTGAGSG